MQIHSISSLVSQLIAVIVSYHDDQRHIKQKLLSSSVNLDSCSARLANLPLDSLQSELKRITRDIIEGYRKQEALLDFLTGHILYLKSLSSPGAAIKPEEISQRISCFLQDLCRILDTPDGTPLQVSYVDEYQFASRGIHGLGKIRGYCHSGQLIHDLVLKNLDIKVTSDASKIGSCIAPLVQGLEHAHKAARTDELEGQLSEANHEISRLKEQLTALGVENMGLINTVGEQDQKIRALREQLRLQTEQVRRLSAQNSNAGEPNNHPTLFDRSVWQNRNLPHLPSNEPNPPPGWLSSLFSPSGS